MRPAILFLTLVALSPPVVAATRSGLDREVERRYSPGHDACIDRAEGRTAPTLSCIGLEIDRQDARLNRTYQSAMKRVPQMRRAALRASQRAWIGRRDNHCRNYMIELDGGGGTMGDMLYNGCILDETIRRTIRLERFASGKASLETLRNDLADEPRRRID